MLGLASNPIPDVGLCLSDEAVSSRKRSEWHISKEDKWAMTFNGKAVLVTGASRGIGRATAKAFLDAGARVAINGRTREFVARAIDSLGANDQLVAAPGDIATVAGCEAVVGAALDGLGGLDILVNNAGVLKVAQVADSDEAVWDFDHRHQCQGNLLLQPCCAARAEGGAWRYCQCCIGGWTKRLSRIDRLLRVQGRDRQPDPRDVTGVGAHRACQLRMSRRDRHRHGANRLCSRRRRRGWSGERG